MKLTLSVIKADVGSVGGHTESVCTHDGGCRGRGREGDLTMVC